VNASPGPRDPAAATGSGLRSDAERNRCRIIAAARRLYAAEGINASMASVAREAKVGVATLFRRFPTRDDLVAAVFADRMDAYAAAVGSALADPDPWHGFTGFVETVCAMQAADRGFADLLTLTFPAAKALEDRRAEAYRGFTELIDRAKAAGRLRPDFSPEDLIILLIANAGVIAVTAEAAPDAWRRLVGYMVQAFAAGGRSADALPDPPAAGAIYRAMLRLRESPCGGETAS
jgi:AcrR family transcriptional regulator